MMACMFTTGIKSVLTRRFRREQSGSQNSGRHWARRLSDGTVSNMTRGRRLVLWGNGSRNNGRGENQGSSLGRASGEAWRSQGESWQSGVSLVWAGVCDQRAGKRSHALRALCIIPNRGHALPTVAAELAPGTSTSVDAGAGLADPREAAEGSPLECGRCGYQHASGDRPS
jgi:hypothetical protein